MQVAWLESEHRLTWEPASALPRSLIDEFESEHCDQQFVTITNTSYGVINHTLTIEKVDSTNPPQAKALKRDTPTSESGYAKFTE